MVDALFHWLDTLPPALVHAVNFVLLVLEGIGLPAIPFEASMLALGLMVHNGQVHLWEAVLLGALGNTLGNVIGYYIGPRGLRLVPEAALRKFGLDAIRRLLERHGPWMAVISRWFGPLRTLFILYARTAGLKPVPYTLCSFVGALTWTAVWQIGMWAGGVAFVGLWHQFQLYALVILAALAVPGYFVWRALKARRARRGELENELEEA